MPPEIVSKIGFLKPITKRIFKKRPFLAYPDKCILCKRCIEMCPKEAISIRENKITFDYNKCIGCLVCCESCMQGALDYKISNSALYKITRKIKKKIIG
jgi:pyruvate formate lyase activating enzyme